MARRFLCFLSCSAILACALVSMAQSAQRDLPGTDPRHFDATEYGERIPLGPNWLFATGDNPAWASPVFDDTGWRTVSTEEELLEYGIRDIPYAWYRIHVHLRPGTHNLMVGTRGVVGRYEIFANGVRIGGLGDMMDRGCSARAHCSPLRFPTN